MPPKQTKAKLKRRRQKPVDSASEFEELLKEVPPSAHYSLRLYVTGNTPRSAQAIENIRGLCEEYLSGRYELEVVDIYQQPGKAVDEQIIAAPTLIKSLPKPPKRLIGDLSDRNKVIIGLNLGDGQGDRDTKWSVV